MDKCFDVVVIGGGLAGSEAALFLADHGLKVKLLEQKPVAKSPAHRLDGLAELVCSNSLKSILMDSASGLYKAELKRLGSRLIPLAESSALPAGGALAVDPLEFSQKVTDAALAHSNIELERLESTELPRDGLVIVATGPLTGDALSESIEEHFGSGRLSFYDAIAPTVTRESLDESRLYQASRYGKGEADYLNAPMDKDCYDAFVSALTEADAYPSHDFEKDVPYFESCLPVEVIAARGPETLRHGTLRPVGLDDPATGRRPWAVLQMRAENREGTLWGLVGCQTKLRVGDQQRIFEMVPALAKAEFVRYGAMHRNFFLDYPSTLSRFQESRKREGLFFAGQMTGVEGYVESMGSGLLAARHLLDKISGREPSIPPETTLTGAITRFLEGQTPGKSQPMNVNFGLLPPLDERVRDKKKRKAMLAERSLAALDAWLSEI
ncbi:methylenetetrahydrofolate--tRNA-(uracil(54)-C(5))-methyltransferase (FADH(2)-oxidizing) TrmFO [bacterium]|nr:methylenetetrahydrofolate--tRNA-(uracil(54)-C(5))-methyltransferase (FADH(2)-oxidizing) TrmFO [bacterium]